MEWFVDNSVYARARTLWTRPIRSGDPAISRIDAGVTTRGSLDRLVYLGLSGTRRARFRLERMAGRHVQRSEFSFPLTGDGNGVGAIDGAQFTIEATPTHVIVTMTRPISSDRVEDPPAQPAG
jgi:hypothetical protein